MGTRDWVDMGSHEGGYWFRCQQAVMGLESLAV